MAGSLTLALRTAQSGLLVNQQALNTVANNIANVNSLGYSRKTITTQPQVVTGIGAGVELADIKRQIDEGLLRSLRIELGNLNELSVQDSFFERMQEVFGTPASNTSISHAINELSAALESLADAPDKTLEQSELVRRAIDFTNKLQDMSTTIQELRTQADARIAQEVAEINKLVAAIGDINDKLIRATSTAQDPTDLQDLRDRNIDQLSQLIDIRIFFRGDGDAVIFTSGGRTLVDNVPAKVTHSAASTVGATSTQAEGDIAGIFVGTPIAGNDITDEIRSGKLKGLIELRDQVLTDFQSQLDELAARSREVFNLIHNRGAPFPGRQSMTGTRIFVAPANQTMTFSGNGDTTLTLFDVSGDQVVTTTMRTLLGGAGPFTINAVATAIQTWLTGTGGLAGATAAVGADGKLAISLNSTARNLVMRDETATALGSAVGDVTIQFDANFDGTIDETVSGFSNFFGLNDFFVDALPDNIHESKVTADTFRSTGTSTLRFNDSTGALTGSPLTIAAGKSLKEIATEITNKVVDVTATVVPDGDGFRLRISHDKGKSLVVTQSAGTLLTDVGMHVADVRLASTLSVRSDIIATPGNVAHAAMQFDSNLGVAGEYFMSIGDDTTAQALAKQWTTANTFEQAGGLASLSLTFAEYGAAIVARNASLSATNKSRLEFQQTLTDSLQNKSDNIRGVNLDEEMAQLIIFEQAYVASARVIVVIQEMFDALLRIV